MVAIWTFPNSLFLMKIVVFWFEFHLICLQGFNYQYAIIGSDNGSAPSRRQAIIRISDDWVYGRDLSVTTDAVPLFVTVPVRVGSYQHCFCRCSGVCSQQTISKYNTILIYTVWDKSSSHRPVKVDQTTTDCWLISSWWRHQMETFSV